MTNVLTRSSLREGTKIGDSGDHPMLTTRLAGYERLPMQGRTAKLFCVF